jgi:hypothetical protein
MDNANTESTIKDRFIVTVAALYLLAVGFLSGMIADRIRFDESRSGLLEKLEEDTHRVHERLMAIEREESRERAAHKGTEEN